MPSDCIFCRIVRGEAPADIVYQDDVVTAFRDIAPQAPTHILLIPNRHIQNLSELDEQDADDLGAMLLAAHKHRGDRGH